MIFKRIKHNGEHKEGAHIRKEQNLMRDFEGSFCGININFRPLRLFSKESNSLDLSITYTLLIDISLFVANSFAVYSFNIL